MEIGTGPRRSPAERLADLEEKKRRLVEEIATLSAREKARTRKDDNRRRMLLGSIVLADLASNAELAGYICARLPSVIRDGDDRLLADLLRRDGS